ncbi:hypothetical protein [Mycobacterium shigaense]|uniref:Uncharacterized protein n=1 Tax=Mycobacterium shigaense TaxID=722731 RepID=A0A1Z4EMM6_9MYCO|nr:hypothetical protein [Mycobacterium shigaense]BAX94247.1 hypothetical protein MSG_04126 [Mycobacterium shigaense]
MDAAVRHAAVIALRMVESFRVVAPGDARILRRASDKRAKIDKN